MAVTSQQLETYRTTLLDMRRRIMGNVGHVVDAINDDANTLANLSSAPVHLADVAQGGIVADVQVLDTENHLIVSIDAALARISEGTYGTCENCGKDIPRERLQALPYLTTCTACAQADEDEMRPKPR
jgi:RNA polymerase-binding protein DksA